MLALLQPAASGIIPRRIINGLASSIIMGKKGMEETKDIQSVQVDSFTFLRGVAFFCAFMESVSQKSGIFAA
ncbi:MAG: hypothetical protein IJ142_00590 [Bacteroidaceae bacterium]|nr:hypothetical protein [Bacteroidaceae bacterium]